MEALSHMKVVLFFGIIRPYKGLHLLLEACIDLPVKLLIVGEIWEDKLIEEEINNYEGYIEFIKGYIDDSDIPDIFKRVDVLALPYLRVSASSVARVGMSFGLPIVATNLPGMIEALGSYDGAVFTDKDHLKEGILCALCLKKGYKVPLELNFNYLSDNYPDVVTIVGPSHRFESGVSHHVVDLANSTGANCVLLRHMLPNFLFPGKTRSKSTTNHQLVHPYIELLDWYNPLTWIRAGKYLKENVILEWWTSSVAHIYVVMMLLFRRNYIIEYHESLDPMEKSNILLGIYTNAMMKVIVSLAGSFICHSNADKDAISMQYNISKARIKVIPLGVRSPATY